MDAWKPNAFLFIALGTDPLRIGWPKKGFAAFYPMDVFTILGRPIDSANDPDCAGPAGEED